MGRIRKEDIVFENPSVIDNIDSHKKGGIIIISHLGNVEISSAIAHQKPGIRLTILVYTRHAEKFNSLMKKVNASARIELLQVTDMSPAIAMVLSERVEAGEYIVIAGDRTPVTGNERVSMVSFLGRRHRCHRVHLSGSSIEVPVYIMFCLKLDDKYHIYVEQFSEQLTFNRKQREQLIDEAVQQYAHKLERYCLKAPLQWFNFFPFWRDGTALENNKGCVHRNE